MIKIINRLILFFIGVPAVFSIIFFFPHKNHLVYNIIVVVFSVLGAGEFKNILTQKNLDITLSESMILGAIIPLAWLSVISFDFSIEIILFAFILGATWILVSQVFIFKKNFESLVNRTAAGFSVMIYPGLFMGFLIRLSSFPNAKMFILFFLFLVFMNDSFAWVFGMLFGKNNRGIISVSPNKSIAGFTGGQIMSVAIGITGVLLFPEVFVTKNLEPVIAGALLGFFTGLMAILGDLCESALKRSSDIKDSGKLILGRGGALDSIDSLLLAAPVFFYLCRIMFSL